MIYTEAGEFEEYLIYPKNPDMVVMDTAIIAKAPVRLLVSGMGDALSTWFEAKACYDARAISMAGGQSTEAALSLARLCYDTLLAEGEKARLAAQAGVVTEALERIIEANTYLSGIGFESSGLAAAHAIHNGFTILEECHHLYHGEKVAFGTLAQLVLQNSPMDEIETVLGFCQRVGLPVTLAQMGVKEGIDEKIAAVAKATCAEGETIHNMPFAVTPESVHAAILTADLLGQQWLARSFAVAKPLAQAAVFFPQPPEWVRGTTGGAMGDCSDSGYREGGLFRHCPVMAPLQQVYAARNLANAAPGPGPDLRLHLSA